MPASKRKSYCKPSISWLFCPTKIWNEQNHEAKKWHYFTRVSAFYRLASQLHRTKISSQIVLPDNSDPVAVLDAVGVGEVNSR